MEMTKKDYVDIIWDWAYDNLEFDTDNEVICYTKSQKEDFIKSLYDNDWSEKDVKIFKKEIESFSYLKEDKKGRSIRIRIETNTNIYSHIAGAGIKKEDPLE